MTRGRHRPILGSTVASLAGAVLLGLVAAACAQAQGPRIASGETPIVFNDNGGWTWFQDERVIVADGQVLLGSIANGSGAGGAQRHGDVEVVAYDLATGVLTRRVLATIDADDHDSPALLQRPDGRFLAVYSNHKADELMRYRISRSPFDASRWRAERTVDNGAPTTYSNVFHLSGNGRTYDFTRTRGADPNILVSRDLGDAWTDRGRLLRDPAGDRRIRPYVKYASNGVDRIFFVSTRCHPIECNSGLHAGFFKGGRVFRMDGSLVGRVGRTLAGTPSVTDLTRVFKPGMEGDVGARTHALTVDLALGAGGRPVVVFVTRAETDRDPGTPDTTDHRFFYGRWTGTRWSVHELAAAGGGLYPREGDFTGLVSLDPNDPRTLYLSSPIDPVTGATLPVHEIFRGVTRDGGQSWMWTAITADSDVENLRPVVPAWDAAHTGVFWLRGTYATFTDYDLAVVGLVWDRDPGGG